MGATLYRIGLVALPMIVLGLHSGQYGAWIVDDAGISFAYARNLATGYGLVAQPGASPVEGYSNPLWVLSLSAFKLLGILDPVWTPKLLSVLLMASCFAVIFEVFRRVSAFPPEVPSAAATIIAAQPSVVGWSISGLENGLLAFLVISLFACCIWLAEQGGAIKISLTAGVLAAAIALTRPEGILYIAAFPICLASLYGLRQPRGVLEEWVAYALAALAPVLAYAIFRRLYFDAWLPNTYLAKGGPSMTSMLGIVHLLPWWGERLLDLYGSVLGRGLVVPVLVAMAAGCVFQRQRASFPAMMITLLFLAIASLAYVLLPPDWMPEYRFGTASIVFLSLLVPMAVWAFLSRFLGPEALRWAIPLAMVSLVGVASWQGFVRFDQLRSSLPISLGETRDTLERFVAAARQISATEPSLLFADVGGPLWADELTIIDLGMLCDRSIATDLGEGSSDRDVSAFHDYVFDERQPTFIATRAYHSWIASLDEDTRFRRDYLPIVEYQDLWIKRRYGERRFSGDYVRRDALGPVPDETLEQLRSLFEGAHYAGCGTCPGPEIGTRSRRD